MTAPMQMQQLAAAALPAYTCPPGTKMHILNLGTMNVDEGWLLTGANGSSASNPNPPSKRRDLMLIAGLIEHPEMGLILFETGSAEDVDRRQKAMGPASHRPLPGHTPGLCIMQVNLPKDGTFIWTTDQFHVRENFEQNQAQGWLLRDHRAWVASGKFVTRLQRLFRARLIFGHDLETAEGLMREKGVWE
ncbi:hypothetical protein BO99DRAFT_448116 [Aspergillus violaceofuscus CBS 115571]|uniref:Uncharacterized protein n=1 Tax=Aspergillus violaceofuscus (strain CBS 115571) TaxID=1450538 RepID=A0A2V5GX26_ASPV1|nr:hypothetical protein BO99DRAFT_448116 [Aspergillus violaceofuscus CBS 115571]